MFANTNNQLLPIIVIDEQGKRVRAKQIKLVVDSTEKTLATIIRVDIKIHPKKE